MGENCSKCFLRKLFLLSMEQVLSEAENNEVELGPAVTVYGSPWPTQCVTHLDLSDLQEDWHPTISRPSQNMLVLNHIYESLRKKNIGGVLHSSHCLGQCILHMAYYGLSHIDVVTLGPQSIHENSYCSFISQSILEMPQTAGHLVDHEEWNAPGDSFSASRICMMNQIFVRGFPSK